jgi:methionyl-tRNA synthetase
MEEKKNFYISTAIAYASAKPHIGNTYEIVLADAIARYKRLTGYSVYFQTGTDEHGQKIEDKARANSKEPQEYVDEVAEIVKGIWDVMNTSYDKFVRTTDLIHKKAVARIFERLYEQGDIYKGNYEGLYCTPCESFFTESQLVDGKCPDCGRPVATASEEAYFLKLDKYAKKLEDYIDSNPEFIEPVSRKNEIVNNFIKPGLQDLCVSRTSFKWGIPVAFDNRHVIYVWIDALSNYITFLGYDGDIGDENFKNFWPADIHLIGKDILRFHTIYWPIMLMALDLPLPKKVFGHPWLLSGDDKMSKSRGNIVYADELVKHFGVDAVRYYLLHEMPFSSDGTFTHELLIERINSDLANILGNLVNRTIAMGNKYFNGNLENKQVIEPLDSDYINKVNNLQYIVEEKMNNVRVADALEEIIDVFRASNKYIDETAPWTLAKDETKLSRLETVLYNLLEGIRKASILLQAYLPETAEKIFEQLGTENKEFEKDVEKYNLGTPVPLFERIDKVKKMEEISN